MSSSGTGADPVPAVRIQEGVARRLDEIYRYTRARWGDAQAEKYLSGMFGAFGKVATHGVLSRPVPAVFGVNGYFIRYRRHFIYWRHLPDGGIGIVTILRERMHQIERFQEDFGSE